MQAGATTATNSATIEEKKDEGFKLPKLENPLAGNLPKLPKLPNLINDFVPNAIKVEGNDGFKEIQKFVERQRDVVDIFNPTQTFENIIEEAQYNAARLRGDAFEATPYTSVFDIQCELLGQFQPEMISKSHVTLIVNMASIDPVLTDKNMKQLAILQKEIPGLQVHLFPCR